MSVTRVLGEIEKIRAALSEGKFPREYEVRQGIVLRLLAAAGWQVFDVGVVYPEYWAGSRSDAVDFALCHPKQRSKFFIEAKSLGNVRKAYEQLFRYVCNSDAADVVPVGIATDGRIWEFFLFADKNRENAPSSCFQRIDLMSEDPAESAKKFMLLLGYQSVGTGSALETARGLGRQVAAGAAPMLRNDPRRSASRRAKVSGALSFTFAGKTVTRGTNEEVMAAVIEMFARRDGKFFDRFRQEQVNSKGEPYIAQTREEIWPDRPDHQRSRSIPLKGGGFIKRLTRHTMARKVITKACETAGVSYGTALKVRLSDGN